MTSGSISCRQDYSGSAVTKKTKLSKFLYHLGYSYHRQRISQSVDLYSTPASHICRWALLSIRGSCSIQRTCSMPPSRRSTPCISTIPSTSDSLWAIPATPRSTTKPAGISMSSTARSSPPAPARIWEPKPSIIRNPTKRQDWIRRSPGIRRFGNHDHFWMGSIPVDYSLRKDLRQSYITDEVFATGDVLSDPRKINSRDYYMGVLDGSTPYGDIKYAGPVGNFKSPPKVAADPDRRSLLRAEWMQEFFKTSSLPAGHGFNLADAKDGFACYSFVPKSNVPLKVIVLDNTQKEDDGSVDIHGHGFLDQARWAWLKKELADGDGGRSTHDHRRACADRRRSDRAEFRNGLVDRSAKCRHPAGSDCGTAKPSEPDHVDGRSSSFKYRQSLCVA